MDGKFWFKALLTGLLLSTLVMAGCEGDDGSDGTVGTPGASAYELAVANGFTGTEQEWLDSLAAAGAGVAEPVETCVVCHGENAFAAAETNHELFDMGAFADFAVTPDVADLVVSFSAEVDGAPATTATFYRAYAGDGTARTTLTDEIEADPTLFTNNDDGTYSIRIVDGVARFGADDLRYLVILKNGVNELEVVAYGDYPAPLARTGLVSNQACINCHGESGEVGRFAPDNRGGHYSAPLNVDVCVVCHRSGEGEPSYMSIARVVHGIHNSHNFPDGKFVTDRDNTYEVTYPTYMTNCSVCHNTTEGLPVANTMPVTGPNCFSCHGDVTSWDFVAAGVPFHTAYDEATNCQGCHNDTADGIARATVAEFHNGLTTERSGLIWEGSDASVTEGARINHQITGVTRTGDSLAITWAATVDGITVDPCNTTATVDAPTFDSGYSVLKAFFQGGDLVNANNGNSAPGQANSTNLDFTAGTGNTVCAANVATTTITLTPEEALLTGDARVALQGKPQILFAPANETISVRAKTPTFDFALATGVAADDRRAVAVSESCLKCHVGSLYQHGGNRVDNVEMCIMCHNEASNEQNVREGMGVVASEAYDGKAGQTYGFKSMLHAIHSAGETGAPIVIYRNRGIYAWAGSEDLLVNWPGTGEQTVVGSDPASPNSIQNHNFHTPTYPRALNNCAACHAATFSMLPDQSVAVATTINAGSEPFDNQLDDVLEGPSAAACMSCHQSDLSFEQNALKAHAYQNGWTPQTFEDGRQTIIDAAQ